MHFSSLLAGESHKTFIQALDLWQTLTKNDEKKTLLLIRSITIAMALSGWPLLPLKWWLLCTQQWIFQSFPKMACGDLFQLLSNTDFSALFLRCQFHQRWLTAVKSEDFNFKTFPQAEAAFIRAVVASQGQVATHTLGVILRPAEERMWRRWTIVFIK